MLALAVPIAILAVGTPLALLVRLVVEVAPGAVVSRAGRCSAAESLILSPPLYSMKPSFLNLFMKKFTRERVVPTISASISWEIFGNTR